MSSPTGQSRTYPTYQSGSGWNAMLPPRAARSAAPPERRVKYLVVGAGYTGLAAARRIAELRPQDRVLVVDATVAGEGSAGRNSGFLINLPHNTRMSGHHSPDRKSTRLNSSHVKISYAVFCLKKKRSKKTPSASA